MSNGKYPDKHCSNDCIREITRLSNSRLEESVTDYNVGDKKCYLHQHFTNQQFTCPTFKSSVYIMEVSVLKGRLPHFIKYKQLVTIPQERPVSLNVFSEYIYSRFNNSV